MNAPIANSRGLRIVAAILCVSAGLQSLAAALAQQPGEVVADRDLSLTTLDGQKIPAKSLQIADGRITGNGLPDGLTIDDLRRIDAAPTGVSNPEKPAVVVELRGGGRVLGRAATIGDDKCLVEWSAGEPLALAIDVVRAVRFEPATASGQFDRAIAAPAADADRIFFKVDGKTDSLAGLIVSLTSDQLTFQLEGQDRKLPRSQLFGIVAAQPQAGDEPARSVVELRDGSRLAGDLTTVALDKAKLILPGGSQVEFPWSAVSTVHVRSSRVAFLSDLKPLAVEESAVVTLPRPWQRDRSVTGKPLLLGPRQFEKGIGVHARSSLTFAADRKYDVLAAVIGIDASTGGKGDCVFTVLGDGQSIFTRRMRGNDPPHDVQLDISRFEQITLLVEPGEGLDLADHADWCDVRMVKQNK